VGLSFAFVGGQPRVQIHNAKHCTVLKWNPTEDLRPLSAIEAYVYKKTVVMDGKFKEKDFVYARLWTDTYEQVWEPIPMEIAATRYWHDVIPSKTIEHGLGFCPFYWIQNIPDSYNVDGESDFAGTLDEMDEINQLFSSAFKGTKCNVDPTVVIREDPALNTGVVRKGAGNAIFSRGGAEYLTLPGDASSGALAIMREAVMGVLERCQCVILDPDAGAVASGESQKIRYMPMLAKCDLLREQYGKAIALITRDMMRAVRAIANKPPALTEDGELSQQYVELEPKIIVETADDGTETVRIVPRPLGSLDIIELNWGPYFPATWSDIQQAIIAAGAAIGGKPVASLETVVKLIASMTGVRDVDAEVRKIEEDAEVAVDRATRAFGAGGPEEAKAAIDAEKGEEVEEKEETVEEA